MRFTCFEWVDRRQRDAVVLDAPDATAAACEFAKGRQDGEHWVIVKGAGPFRVVVGHGHIEATPGLPPP